MTQNFLTPQPDYEMILKLIRLTSPAIHRGQNRTNRVGLSGLAPLLNGHQRVHFFSTLLLVQIQMHCLPLYWPSIDCSGILVVLSVAAINVFSASLLVLSNKKSLLLAVKLQRILYASVGKLKH